MKCTNLFTVFQNTNTYNVLKFTSKTRTESFLFLFWIKDWGERLNHSFGETISLHDMICKQLSSKMIGNMDKLFSIMKNENWLFCFYSNIYIYIFKCILWISSLFHVGRVDNGSVLPWPRSTDGTTGNSQVCPLRQHVQDTLPPRSNLKGVFKVTLL